ncbi:hypothetical protein [Caulobacter sp. BE254]|uniref:hypothetical protein n=1 Tax=Caulobacter sp. BE254 TaxID=2817720 RepID=UPI0028568F6B|nr:hypothetical protein [Caulobacter sp. BE254]MDR7117202.1 hypothetical protein [Caulobacter sp. BE254]
MRVIWERMSVVAFSGAAWLLVLLGAPHMLHALRGPPQLMAHASVGRRRDQG